MRRKKQKQNNHHKKRKKEKGTVTADLFQLKGESESERERPNFRYKTIIDENTAVNCAHFNI